MELWHRLAFGAFLASYRENSTGQAFVPQNTGELDLMLKTYLLDKACIELERALSAKIGQPEWPLHAVNRLLGWME